MTRPPRLGGPRPEGHRLGAPVDDRATRAPTEQAAPDRLVPRLTDAAPPDQWQPARDHVTVAATVDGATDFPVEPAIPYRPPAPVDSPATMTGSPAVASAAVPSPAMPTPAMPTPAMPTPAMPTPAMPSAVPGPAANGGPVMGMATDRPVCTAPQLRRFIKSRVYVPMHELRRRFGINGTEDDVTRIDVGGQRIYLGLPEVEGQLLAELMRGGDVGYELSLDPRTPIVVGVYPMRPVPRP
jgi:hypothetical protein